MNSSLSDVIIEQQIEITELKKRTKKAESQARFIAFWCFIFISFIFVQNATWVLQNY